MLLIDKSPDANKLAPSAIAKSGSSHFAFAGDFTLEIFKLKFASTSTQVLLGNWNAFSPFSNQRSWQIQYTTGALQFVGSTNGSSIAATISYTWTPTLGTEYAIAVDRSGSTVRLYVDGTKQANGTIASALWASTTTYLTIGQASNGSGFSSPTDASAKALRITNGVARYATNTSYTVPSLPLPTQ
jgi:hypothetical protein